MSFLPSALPGCQRPEPQSHILFGQWAPDWCSGWSLNQNEPEVLIAYMNICLCGFLTLSLDMATKSFLSLGGSKLQVFWGHSHLFVVFIIKSWMASIELCPQSWFGSCHLVDEATTNRGWPGSQDAARRGTTVMAPENLDGIPKKATIAQMAFCNPKQWSERPVGCMR